MSIVRSVAGVLRSRRVAVGAILAVLGYAVLASVVPQTMFSTAVERAQWAERWGALGAAAAALGLHDAYTTPLFLVLAILLTLSTLACAWERTSSALRSHRVSTQPNLSAARETARFSLIRSSDPEADANELLVRCTDVFRARRMRVRVGDSSVTGVARPWGSLGSPLLHWALVGLFVFSGLGQLTKWEGKIGVPIGHPLQNDEEYFGFVRKGPASGTYRTGLTLNATDFTDQLEVDGVERGFSAVISAVDGDGRTIARGHVYPNSPLRFGATTVHREEWGVSAILAIETSVGAELGRRYEFFEFELLEKDGRIRVPVPVPIGSGESTAVVALPLDESDPGTYVKALPASLAVEVSLPAEVATTTVVALRPGEVVNLPSGELVLKLIDIVPFMRLYVVRDWTVSFVYLMFVLASIGAALALLFPARYARATVEVGEDQIDVSLQVRARKVDPAFASRLAAELAVAITDAGYGFKQARSEWDPELEGES